jgi:hypothetical protein
MRASSRRTSAISSAASRRRVAARTSRGRTRRSRPAAASALSSRGAPPGTRCASSTCRRFTVWVRALTRSSRCSVSARNAIASSSNRTDTNAGAVHAATATDSASASSVLRPCPVDSVRTRAASFAGTSATANPSANNRVASGAPKPLAPSIAHRASAQFRGKPAQLPVPLSIRLHPNRPLGPQRFIHRHRRPRALVRIDRNHHRTRRHCTTTRHPTSSTTTTTTTGSRRRHTDFGRGRPLFSHSPRRRWPGRRPKQSQPHTGRQV